MLLMLPASRARITRVQEYAYSSAMGDLSLISCRLERLQEDRPWRTQTSLPAPLASKDMLCVFGEERGPDAQERHPDPRRPPLAQGTLNFRSSTCFTSYSLAERKRGTMAYPQ